MSLKEQTAYSTYMRMAKLAFRKAAGDRLELDEAGLTRALQEFHNLPHGVWAAELGPVMLHMFDESGDGLVNEREFLVAQAIIYAASEALNFQDLQDLCWRSLDLDRNGSIDRRELTTMVRLMVALGAIREEDHVAASEQHAESLHSQGHERIAAKRIKNSRMKSRAVKKNRVEELVDHYLFLYTGDCDGHISKADFDKHTALVENFWRLINKSEMLPALFLSEDSDPSSIVAVKDRGLIRGLAMKAE